jgi:ankyrin repeat protein
MLESEPALLHVTDGGGLTALHQAVLGRHAELTAFLLEHGANVAAVDAQDRTPLHHAAFQGDAACLSLLLARGSDVMAREFRGRTPLFLATNWGRDLETVELLIAAGADVNDRTERGEEVLFSTLFYGMPEIIDALLEAGARLPANENDLRQSVFLSASNGYEGVFRMAAAENEARGISWWEDVPMHAAARGGSVSIGESLLEKGLPVNEKNMYGITPLHVAAEHGRLAFVEFLIGLGADIDDRSATGKTPLHFARENNHENVASRLIELGASSAPAEFPELRGPWLGQPEPGNAPVRFALGIVSGHGFNSEHSPAAFSPDGTEVYWTKAFRGPILYSKLEDGRWTAPRTAPFVSEYGDGEPIFSPDGRRLYFLSQRPLDAGGEPGKENIWYVEREGEGWSQPQPLDAVVNEYRHHWLFSITESGTLYFASIREDGHGRHDIYRSPRVNGVHQPPENLGSVINTEETEHTPYVAPDESYLIFSSSGHGLETGTSFHFLISYRKPDGGWSTPIALDHITAPVEQPLCPLITADARFMFLIGSGDIWWTRADFIEELRPN